MILQAIRKSLRGQAKQVLVSAGSSLSADEIIKRLERIFGNVSSSECIFREFYTASQNQSESAVTWGLRLGEILKNGLDKGYVKPENKSNMLCERFWNGLKSERLKNATRIDYRNITDFDELLSRVREEEKVLNLNQGVQHQPVPVSLRDKYSNTVEESSKLDLVFETLNELKDEMSELKKKSRWPKRPYNPDKGAAEERPKEGPGKKDF